MSDEITKRKERLNLPHNLKERYEKSGLACTYEEWLEDAVRELVMSTQTRWDRITELEQENERITRAWLKIQKREIETDKNIDELRTEANELIDALRSEVSALEIENTSLMAARMEALEIYAGMEGFESKTAPEAYCQRIIEQMAKALLVHEEV